MTDLKSSVDIQNNVTLIGGMEFIRQHPRITIPFLLIMTLASVIGTFGNVLIMLCLVVYRPLRHHRNIFLFNLALSDLCVTAIADPYSIVGEF